MFVMPPGSDEPCALIDPQATTVPSFFNAAKANRAAVIYAWGDAFYGSCNVPSGLSNVKELYSADHAYTALLNDDSLRAWGSYGGNVPSALTQPGAGGLLLGLLSELQ